MENSNRGLDGCYCNPVHSNKLSEIPPEQESKALLDRKNSQLGKIMKSRSSLVENKTFDVPFKEISETKIESTGVNFLHCGLLSKDDFDLPNHKPIEMVHFK